MFLETQCIQILCELLAANSNNMLFKVAKFAKIIMLQVESS